MEPNESGLSSYYHHQPLPPPPHQQSPTGTAAATATATSTAAASTATVVVTTSPTNGIPNYPQSVGATPPLENLRRKRGRPRKYGTPEQAAAARRAAASSAAAAPISQPKKKDQFLGGSGGSSSLSSSSKKTQLAALGNTGQGFTPHIISVVAGEDVYQKVMLFMQQSKSEICILSASGSISNPSLRQPATSGGNITYEGRFDILSLSGSYIRTEHGGRTGGLSVCLSSVDGQIIGGGIGGPLRAAGPVQVIVGTFLIETKKDIMAGTKGDASVSKFPSPVGGASVSGVGFRSAVDSSGRIPVRDSEDHQSISGSQFMIQPCAMQVTTLGATDWRTGTDTRSNACYNFSGHDAHHSPANGDYDQQIQD